MSQQIIDPWKMIADLKKGADESNAKLFRDACCQGQLEVVKTYIEVTHFNAKTKYGNGWTGVHFASQHGHLHIVKYFIQKCRTDVLSTKTDGGWNALHVASYYGHLNIVKYLQHECRVDATAKINDGRTAYDVANSGGKKNVAEYLLQVTKRNAKDLSSKHQELFVKLLVDAAGEGNLRAVTKSIDSGVNVDAQTSESWNALRKASAYGHLHIVMYLIEECHANVKSKDDSSGWTNLHIASWNGKLDIVRYFVQECHVNVEEKEVDGNTALQLACQNSSLDIVRFLIQECHADLATKANDGWIVVHSASATGQLDVLRFLIQVCHLDVEAKDNSGNTALHLASQRGHLGIVLFLIQDCRANVSCTNDTGNTAYDLADKESKSDITTFFKQYEGIEKEFFASAESGNLDIIRKCLNEGVHAETQNINKSTALHFASRYGHLEIVQYLTRQYQVSVESRNKNGCSALHFASSAGHLDIVRYLVEDCKAKTDGTTNDGETAYDLSLGFGNVALSNYLSQLLEKTTDVSNHLSQIETKTTPLLPASPSANNDLHQTIAPEIIADRKGLEIVINDPTVDPIVLSVKYLELCTDNFTSKVLGEGAFGRVYFGCDKELGIQIAVKRITLLIPNQDALDEITLSFKREIAVLKRFRHPNIVVMYGYNVIVDQNSQFLVYEYLSNGSLAVYLKDEKDRIRLPSNVRLSIMFQLARSVHFLHTGGCDNLAVFHRDLKSGNICLTQDYTAKLIDCGLAKFVLDSTGDTFQGSVSPTILKSSGAAVFGTPGYICPMYARGQSQYTTACDVFSIGVVFAELLTGCLQGGQSSRAGQSFGDYFSRYIKDEDDEPVENGWEILRQDSDVVAQWNDAILEKLCKIVVQCMAASPKRRLSTHALVQNLSEISSFDFTASGDMVNEDVATDSITVQELSLNEPTDTSSNSNSNCVLCNRSTCHNVACVVGHPTCVQCIEQGIQVHLGKSGDSFRCKCFALIHDSALFGKISMPTYNCYIRERSLQKTIEEKFDGMKLQLNRISSMSERNHDDVMSSLKGIGSNVQRVLGGLAYVATNSVQHCPTVVWLVPSDRSAGNSAKAWKQWAKNLTHKKYDLYFICQHSFEVVETKMDITVPRSWLTQAAPALVLSMFLLKTALSIGGLPALPFPFPAMSRADQISMNEEFVTDLLDDATMKLVDSFKAAYTNGSDLPYSESTQLLTLTGSSYEGIVAKATSMKRCHWKQSMEPVTNHRGSIIWIKNEYRDLY